VTWRGVLTILITGVLLVGLSTLLSFMVPPDLGWLPVAVMTPICLLVGWVGQEMGWWIR
jgi:hypothetical protein